MQNLQIGDSFTVGRDADYKITGPGSDSVSRVHGTVVKSPDGSICFIDSSTNGTTVEGILKQGSVQRKVLPANFELQLGEQTITLPPININNNSKTAGLNLNDLESLKQYIPDIGLVRDPAKIDQINPQYRQNSAEARQYLEQAMQNEAYNDPQSYTKAIQEAHKLSYAGSSGKNNYYTKRGSLYFIKAGEIRHKKGALLNRYKLISIEVEKIAQNYGDPYSADDSHSSPVPVKLEGIPKAGRAYNYGDTHIYPDGSYMPDYFNQMQRTAQEALNLMKEPAPQKLEIVKKIAEHLQYAANARPFEQINISLFMNETNLMLKMAGLNEIPHGIIDHVAQRLQPEAFTKYFLDQVRLQNPEL